MEILTEISKLFESATNDAGHRSLLMQTIKMLTSEGGLDALSQSFQRNGLGHVVSSWIGNGENLPVSSDQINTVLGRDVLSRLAATAGISPDTAKQYLTKSLPALVDALTPNGRLGSLNDLVFRGREMLDMFVSKKDRI
jgi:uncharacterized protein YidB (DUF937 family)